MDLSKFIDCRGNVSSSKLRSITKDEIFYIIQKSAFIKDDSVSIGQRIKILYNEYTYHPVCEVCNISPQTLSPHSGECFKRTCSFTCAMKHPDRTKSIVDNTNYSSRNAKTRKTNLKRYGVEHVFQNKTVKNKIKKSNLNKYGKEYISQVKEIKDKVKDTRANNQHLYKKKEDILLDKTIKFNWWWNNLDILQEKLKQYNNNIVYMAECEGIAHSTIYNAMERHGIYEKGTNSSLQQMDVERFVSEDLKQNIITNSRKIIPPKEVDIFIPEHNLAIEYHGLYWHTEDKVGKTVHRDKYMECKEQNIQLLQIFENEWILKQDIVKSRIRNALGLSNKIYARKCKVGEIYHNEAEDFLNYTHIQGSSLSSIRLGLYYNDSLVSVMTFGKSRYNKDYEYELLRFSSKLDTTVIGGASKLFNYFIKNYNPKSVISYCDLRYGSGKVYENMGFKFDGYSEPNYFYFQKDSLLLESRVKYQKHKLKEKLEKFDPALTEFENMYNNGYDRIYDAGNARFVYC